MNGKRYSRTLYRLDKADRTQEGFLQGIVPISALGVFPYKNEDGTLRWEARLPEHVFAKESVDSFRGIPIQVEHNEMLDNPGAVARQKVGQVGDNVFVDGNFVRANVKIDHPEGLRAFDEGIRELSCGYTLVVVEQAGTYMGKAYTHVQTEIRGDHLAITRRARLGPELRLDSADAVEVDSHPLPQEHPMKKIRIDSVDYEVPPQVAVAFDAMEDKIATMAKDAKKKDEEMEEKEKEHKKATDSLQGQLAAAQSDKKKAEDALADLEKDIPNRAAAIAKDRADALVVAQAVLPEADMAKLDSADAAGIRAAVVKAKYPDIKLDGQSADFATGLFESVKASVKTTGSNNLARNRSDSAQPAGGAQAHEDGAAKPGSAEEARQRMHKRNLDAWKTPAFMGSQTKAA